MPYRVEIPDASEDIVDRLIELGALDVEPSRGGVAALMPDSVTPSEVKTALRLEHVSVSAAVGRDLGSVWVLSPRPLQVGALRIVPAGIDADPGALRLVDSAAFGTGLHATTALCLEALLEIIETTSLEAVLDVGTGSGVLALAALLRGVPRALGIDTDEDALRIAAENARLNRLDTRLQLARGGPESVTERWPLVLANILAAPLIEMAPALVRCVGHHGRLVLSGIPSSVAGEVDRAYRRLGMRTIRSTSRQGWEVLILQATW